MKRKFILIVILGIFLLLSSEVAIWANCLLIVTNTSPSGRGEFILEVYHADKLHSFFSFDEVNQIHEAVGLRPFLLLRVFVRQDAILEPYKLQFVQGRNQYQFGYDDIRGDGFIKIGDVFWGDKLRAGVEVYGLLIIPEIIDIDSPITIYYDDTSAVFTLEEEIVESDIVLRIIDLEEEKAQLEARIKEINEELWKLKLKSLE